ncbi:hypothetical protein [Actinomadura oligospora]|uniref:hypothetical protein n=1 Tax=Actinomadura oligospora TaxID=111804 RepID=UPI00047DC39E|nr:hypothetical protein [Actinomadura oligospora]
MKRSHEDSIRKALVHWEAGRQAEADGKFLLAAHKYTRGLGSFLSYVKLAEGKDPAPAYFAFGCLGRELTRLLLPASRHSALQNARMALAASHIADPTRGDVPGIEQAVRDGRPRPLYQLSLGGERAPLTPELRIAGAADARDLLASVLEIPFTATTRKSARALWVIEDWDSFGKWLGYHTQKKRFFQAVLPSCAGMDEEDECHRLKTEADAIFAELKRVSPQFLPGKRI